MADVESVTAVVTAVMAVVVSSLPASLASVVTATSPTPLLESAQANLDIGVCFRHGKLYCSRITWFVAHVQNLRKLWLSLTP